MIKSFEQFIEYIEYEKKYSTYTVCNYQRDLEQFIQFLEVQNISSFRKVDHRIIRTYIMHLYECQYANKSMSRQISTLRSFFRFLVKQNLIQDNPMIFISNPKQEKRLPHFLYYQDLETLLELPDQKSPLGIRNRLLLEMLYSTGVRVSELVGITLFDINFDDRVIKIHGKGNKERYVIYGELCAIKLQHYLDHARNNLQKSKTDILFLNKNGGKLTERGVRSILDEIVHKGSLRFHVSPHMLRHTFATHMLNEGADLKTVQELLGHENLSTTGIYTHVSNEHMRKVYLDAHPRAKRG